MEENKLPDLMTVTEVAKVLRMTSQAIRDMIKPLQIEKKQLPAFPLHRIKRRKGKTKA